MQEETVVETDVLVIGGGIAGCFAAMKARDKGVDVTLVDKASVAKSGGTAAEMILKASLFRTESRGQHYREDHPHRDDPFWLAWVKLEEQDGEMRAVRVPVPEKWWPDLDTPYEERYPQRFLLEDV